MDQQTIMRISTEIYRKLYNTEKVNDQVQENYIQTLKLNYRKEKQTDLDQPITDKEIENAIQYISKGKSPGLNGFLISIC